MLYDYHSLVRKKQGEIHRLTMCQSDLRQKQQYFLQLPNQCLEPELTPDSWEGQNTIRFQNIREDMKVHILNLAEDQFNRIISTLNTKIDFLHSEIASIQQIISNLQQESS
ncbi:YwqH-like family protein [Bacillus sp. T33-2]|uniref:YwqH-like family protein n=1 Tax=Bacillus sp. T33-2 TaxID=2054168 RepID=UPI000C78A44A|nr:DUF5082 family protein [Bacillus sp. T33-2]PLR95914.1 hypothetical protein CVD19_12890 [Bacillus sp. T33-2]